MTYIIADSLIRIKNGYLSQRETVDLKFSKINLEILNILKREGYLKDFKISVPDRTILVTLLYVDGQPSMQNVEIVSKPGRRIYGKTKHLPTVMGNLGLSVVSTSKGLFTSTQARKEKVGGEVLFKIW